MIHQLHHNWVILSLHLFTYLLSKGSTKTSYFTPPLKTNPWSAVLAGLALHLQRLTQLSRVLHINHLCQKPRCRKEIVFPPRSYQIENRTCFFLFPMFSQTPNGPTTQPVLQTFLVCEFRAPANVSAPHAEYIQDTPAKSLENLWKVSLVLSPFGRFSFTESFDEMKMAVGSTFNISRHHVFIGFPTPSPL